MTPDKSESLPVGDIPFLDLKVVDKLSDKNCIKKFACITLSAFYIQDVVWKYKVKYK